MAYRRMLHISIVPLAILCATTPGDGQASTNTATIAVSASVLSYCVISASPLAFTPTTGYNAQAVVNATTTVTPTCTFGTPYNIGLDPGQGPSATVSVRKMTYTPASTTYTLNYSLYSDSGHTVVWGNTIGTGGNIGASTYTVPGTGNGAAQPLTVYGQIPAAQYVTPGSYTDTVTATVTW